jgi:hypothetical protein
VGKSDGTVAALAKFVSNAADVNNPTATHPANV